MIRWKIKLYLQFFYYVLFNKGNFKLGLIKRLNMAFNGGFTANQFYIFNLRENDRREYLSEYDWFKSRLLNKPYDYILNDKFLFNEIARQYVAVPEIYAVKKDGSIESRDRCGCTESDVLNLIKEKRDVILKSISSGKGNGVFHIQFSDTGAMYIDGRFSNDDEVISKLTHKKNWIVTERIKQADYSESIYPGCLNTMRILVIKDCDSGLFKIINAVHRFGTSSTGAADNASRGGIVSQIDIATGAMTEALSIKNLNIYYFHPDTNVKIKGAAIPGWENIKKEIIELSERFFYLKMIAWDVAVTSEGLFIIEANSSSGVNILQLWEGQRNKELGEFLKYHKIIR